MIRELALKNFLLELHKNLPALTDAELYDHVLRHAIILSESGIGFLHLVSDDQKTIHLTTWNDEALKTCSVTHSTHYAIEDAGNWVDCVRLGHTVIHNDYATSPNRRGLPEGHAPLHRFMSVPVVEEGRTRIIFGLGNKAEDYSERDASIVQVIANDLGRIIRQRGAEKALSRSEAYYRSLIENASDMIAILNADGSVSYGSPSMQTVLGYAPGDLRGRSVLGLVHDDDLPAAADAFATLIERPGRQVRQEIRFRHKSGGWRILDVTAGNLLNDEAVRGIVVNSHDITPRKELEHDLVRERNNLKTLLDFYRKADTDVYDVTSFIVERCIKISGSRLGFFGFIDENESLMTTYLWSEKAIERCAIDFRPVKFSIEHAGVWADAIRMRGPLVLNDFKAPHPGKKGYPEGHVPIRRLVSLPILKEGRAVAVMAVANKDRDYTDADLLHLSLFLESAWDIIARKEAEEKVKEQVLKMKRVNERLRQQILLRKRAERERAESERRLRRAEKAESLGRMAGAIAHHFNNLLGVVLGNLELATLDLPRGSSALSSIDEAMTASRRAADISGLMLAYLGQGIGKTAAVDLSEICREALPLLAQSLPKGVRLKTEPPDRARTIRADAIQIRQILGNLVVNAGEAMAEGGGEVTLAIHEISADDIPRSRRHPPEWEPSSPRYIRISVSDTGPGMDAETLDKVFDPFFSTKFTGRGLGLSVVLGAVKAHEGMVTVESNPGRGAVFRVFLPLPAEETRARGAAEPAFPDPTGGRSTVLLVDDEPMYRRMAGVMLGKLGYEVITASDGVEAIERFREHRHQIGCVLLDLSMPRMDGWETLAALREIEPDLPVILASGYDEAEVMEGRHLQPPQVFLGKPYQLSELETALWTAQRDSLRRSAAPGSAPGH